MFTTPAHIKQGTAEAAAFYVTKRARREYNHVRTDEVEFDAFDAKGRRHGYQVAFASFQYIREDCGSNSWLVDDENLGIWFSVQPHALKDGKTFGALQPAKRFRTLAEAETAAAGMIERARKAAAKKN